MTELAQGTKCSACNTPLSREGDSVGLCPGCLLELALDDTSFEAEVLGDPEEAPTLQYSGYTFEEGQIQGERYRVRSLLGRGGMGEVWRAYDLKLRQDVALKALRTELIEDTDALETLRQEVRTAREVISPNVCRVFDLQELDGQELVSMEYIDGTTLQEILKERSPLDLDEAREIASQFLAGLEAIHEAGLIHRDIKPENVMVTRTGRVVVMDFGIAKGLGDGKGGLIAGTPAYMSPKQSQGDELDARSDVFSAGVVLAEMVAPGGLKSFEDRRKLWEAIHQEEPELDETPWSRVIGRCVAGEPSGRYATAAELARALEEVTLRAVGDDTAQPYPGLSAFQEEDAEYFYGRELEVEALWKKLRRPHLLAVIGPSGAGKSSFLRAGLMPTLTDGWQALISTPGNRPFDNLARALASHLGEAAGTAELLQRFDEPDIAVELLSDWRNRSRYGLIILDQFEELFTQNPDELQERFAELLSRLPLESDVHVLLSMRDDFLFHCHRFEAFHPILTDLTLLGPPTGAALRRALVEPALRCGYRFEEEAIIEEMLTEVEGQRGALPLLAFAAAQLWERRDRETGLLTRKSYAQIGGVGGALAQHAEAILDRVGESNIPIVRELFRNLVTAQGTRAARDREELLSVFAGHNTESGRHVTSTCPPDSAVPLLPAAEVLNSLIDARLLTSYEVPATDEGGEPRHRIELVHESLLARWPRLVRWQREDADSAQMRDELRSQAKLWNEHGRSEDYLWTGTAFKEYELWHERYPGGLTEIEEAFTKAMVSFAARRRRRRRIAVAVVIAVLLIGLTVVGSFWRQAVKERQRAEAGKLLALGELEINTYPTATLAWATKSLELADTSEGRMLSLRALSKAPPVTVAPPGSDQDGISGVSNPAFSPDGRWLAFADARRMAGDLWVRHRDGGEPRHLFTYPDKGGPVVPKFLSEDVLLANQDGDFRWLSVPDGREIHPAEDGRGQLHSPCDSGYFSISTAEGRDWIRWWPFEAGASRLVGSMPTILAETASLQKGYFQVLGQYAVDATCSWLAYPNQNSVYLRSLEDWSRPPRRIGEHAAEVLRVSFHPNGDRVAASDGSNAVRVWSIVERHVASPEPLRSFDTPFEYPTAMYDATGRYLVDAGLNEGIVKVWLWDQTAPAEVEPLILTRSDVELFGLKEFHPTEPWMAMSSVRDLAFWPLLNRYPRVLRAGGSRVWDVAFSPDGQWLVSAEEEVRAWPLQGQNRGASRSLFKAETYPWWTNLSFHPSGEYVASSYSDQGVDTGVVSLLPMDGGPIRELPDKARHGVKAFSPDGRFLATAPGRLSEENPDQNVIRVWNLESDEVRSLGPLPAATGHLSFDDNRHLRWSCGAFDSRERGEERIFDLEDGSVEVQEGTTGKWIEAVASDRPARLVWEVEEEETGFYYEDLTSGVRFHITTHGAPEALWTATLDPSGRTIVTGDAGGLVRVGPVTGEEPHLLFGHKGAIETVEVSPDGRWIASGGHDGTVRLWPMPDLDKPPLHTLLHDELITKLHSLTNLRIVEDPESSTGWKLDYAPFPGWAEVPEW